MPLPPPTPNMEAMPGPLHSDQINSPDSVGLSGEINGLDFQQITFQQTAGEHPQTRFFGWDSDGKKHPVKKSEVQELWNKKVAEKPSDSIEEKPKLDDVYGAPKLPLAPPNPFDSKPQGPAGEAPKPQDPFAEAPKGPVEPEASNEEAATKLDQTIADYISLASSEHLSIVHKKSPEEVKAALEHKYQRYLRKTGDTPLGFEEWVAAESVKIQNVIESRKQARQNRDNQPDQPDNAHDHDHDQDDEHNHEHLNVEQSRLKRLGKKLGKWGLRASVIATPYALVQGGSVVNGLSTGELDARLTAFLENPNIENLQYSGQLYLPLGILAANSYFGVRKLIRIKRDLTGQETYAEAATRRQNRASERATAKQHRRDGKNARRLDSLIEEVKIGDFYAGLDGRDSRHTFAGIEEAEDGTKMYKFTDADNDPDKELLLTRDEIGERLFPGLDTRPKNRRSRRRAAVADRVDGPDVDPVQARLDRAEAVIAEAEQSGNYTRISWEEVLSDGRVETHRVVAQGSRGVRVSSDDGSGEVITNVDFDQLKYILRSRPEIRRIF